MSSQESICRLCSGTKLSSDLVSDLSDTEPGSLSVGELVNFYCRVQLKTSGDLSTKVCRVCRLHLETFIAFSDTLKKAESSLDCDLSLVKKRSPSLGPSEANFKQERSSVLNSEKKKTSLEQSRLCLENVMKLYKKELNMKLFDLDEFQHVTVPHEYVLANGEISLTWLEKYDLETWKDSKYYNCQSCNIGFPSFKDYLDHIEATPCKFKLSCSSKYCYKSFANFNSFVNHRSKMHKSLHLLFTCVVCNKLLYNMTSLIKHIGVNHGSVPNFYPCIECGYFANSLTSLRIHYMTHKMQEVSDSGSSDDEEELVSPSAGSSKHESQFIPVPAVKRAATKIEDKEAEVSRKRRKTFACDKCDRELLTPQGLIAHKCN